MLGSDEDELDIVGLWEESLEDTIRKAYSDGLPLRTRRGDKVYLVQISESDNPLIRDLPVFGVMSDIASHRWGGFTDLLSAELWLNQYLKEHKIEVEE